jgi:hypothetical protein
VDLETLLGPVPVPVFLDQYFGRNFLHVPGSPHKISRLLAQDEGFAILAQNIERALEAPVRAHGPGSSAGVALHCRERDGIFLQLDGQSHCKIYDDSDEPAGNPPKWEAILKQGDALYLPRGWWLSLAAGGLQVGFDIENPTGEDLLKWLVRYVKRHQAFRSDIPRFADPLTKADYITGIRKTLAKVLRGPGLLEAFRRETNLTASARPAFGVPWTAEASGDDWIEFLTPRKIRIKRADDETLLLVAMGKRLALPTDAAPLLHYLSDKAPVAVEEFYRAFEEEFDRAELSDLLSALSRDGIIGLRHPGSI